MKALSDWLLFCQSILGMSRDMALWGVDKAEVMRQMCLYEEHHSRKHVSWTRSKLDRISELIDQKLNEERERLRNGNT